MKRAGARGTRRRVSVPLESRRSVVKRAVARGMRGRIPAPRLQAIITALSQGSALSWPRHRGGLETTDMPGTPRTRGTRRRPDVILMPSLPKYRYPKRYGGMPEKSVTRHKSTRDKVVQLQTNARRSLKLCLLRFRCASHTRRNGSASVSSAFL